MHPKIIILTDLRNLTQPEYTEKLILRKMVYLIVFSPPIVADCPRLSLTVADPVGISSATVPGLTNSEIKKS
uniref:Uncharacterized protein n=1 Tax=Romanomermis culicivorax TaxID=13658 RepID=A0A915HHY6_ROMCU